MSGEILFGLSRLQRGRVWCLRCGSTFRVNVSRCMGHGWPECCGETMTIDSPTERRSHGKFGGPDDARQDRAHDDKN